MSGGPESAVSRETVSRETEHRSDHATSSGNGDDGFTAPYNGISAEETPIGAAAHRASQVLHPNRRSAGFSQSPIRRAGSARPPVRSTSPPLSQCRA
jgi:chromosome partitioning protein